MEADLITNDQKGGDNLLQLERQQDILRLLGAQKSMTVKELSAALYASPATIRRDLAEMERAGLLRRSFGGAVLTESYPDQMPLSVRAADHISEKKRICTKAAQWIQPGETIFIDASSTTYFLIPHLRSIPDLTVITNNPNVNIALAQQNIRSFCTGGEMLNGSVALVGSEAERFVRGVHAHAFFFSARGVCDGVISDSSAAERNVKIAMMEHASRRYFLYDTSKAGQLYPFIIARVDDLDATADEI